MIINRLAIAIRHQNWSQIITEILIVVIGIFLGLQVTSWNDERLDRVQERVYLTRLHSDVLDALNFNEVNFSGIVLAQQFYDFDKLLDEIGMVFDGTNIEIRLDDQHCFAIMASHIYNDLTIDIPTIQELTTSGQLTLIKSENIKQAIARFSFGLEGVKSLVTNANSSTLVLARKYPELIQLDGKMRNIQLGGTFSHQCQFEEMRVNTGFQNDLIDNGSRMKAFVLSLRKQQELLNILHEELDIELEINHEGIKS